MSKENPLEILIEADPDPSKVARAASQISSLSEHYGEAGGLGMVMYGDDAPQTPVIKGTPQASQAAAMNRGIKIEATYNL